MNLLVRSTQLVGRTAKHAEKGIPSEGDISASGVSWISSYAIGPLPMVGHLGGMG